MGMTNDGLSYWQAETEGIDLLEMTIGTSSIVAQPSSLCRKRSSIPVTLSLMDRMRYAGPTRSIVNAPTRSPVA